MIHSYYSIWTHLEMSGQTLITNFCIVMHILDVVKEKLGFKMSVFTHPILLAV